MSRCVSAALMVAVVPDPGGIGGLSGSVWLIIGAVLVPLAGIIWWTTKRGNGRSRR